MPPPTYDTTTVIVPPANPNDVIEIPGDTLETFPDCSSGGLTGWEIDYCQSSLPSSTQESRIEDAFDRIEQRGEVCQKIAARGRLYLNEGILRIFPNAARAGGYGGAGLVMIYESWVNHWYNQATEEHIDGEVIRRNLDHVLSHELEHVLLDHQYDEGLAKHTDALGYETPHSKQCSGLSYSY